MCGIAGIVRPDGARPVEEIALRRMARAVRHRGPGSHQANANWPLSLSSAARPSRSSRRSTTSVSLVVSRLIPSRASSARSSGWLKTSPL